eukprot:COSAG05_NODE_10615_length_555_cov_1.975877_1_plen_28_part_10
MEFGTHCMNLYILYRIQKTIQVLIGRSQ